MSGTGGWLARTGILLIALGPLPALFGALDLVGVPALAIVAHVAMMISGVLFMCVGLAWPWEPEERPAGQSFVDRHLVASEEVWARRLLVGGSYGAIATVIIAALLGVGGDAMAVIPGGIIGPPRTELLLRLALGASGLSVSAALFLVLRHLLREPDGDRPADRRAEAPTGDRLLRWGLGFFGVGVLSAVLTGLLPVRWLGMATHVGVLISGLVLMGFGHVLPELRALGEKAQQRVFWLLLLGAGGTVVTGVLSLLMSEGDSVLDVFFTGFIGTGFDPVQFFALASVLSMGVGAVTVWVGFPEAGTPSQGAMKRLEDTTTRIVRLGVVLVVFALVAAFFTGLTRVPRVAVGTWATVLIIGPMVMCFGLVWGRSGKEEEDEDRRRTAYGFLRYGAVGLLITGIVLAILGIGGDTLGISAEGWLGTEAQELVAKIAVDGFAVVLAIGLVLVWRGTRARTPASLSIARSVRNRAERIAYAVLFVLILQIAFYHVLAKVYFGDAYPVRLMDYALGDADDVPVTWVYDDATYETAQNWTQDDWLWFYHAPQGGAFELPVPYDWMMALEQPTVPLWPRSEVGRLMDPSYLEGFGFLPNPVTTYRPCGVSVNLGRINRIMKPPRIHDACARGVDTTVVNNPDALPVGFTKVENWIDHATGKTIDAMGFTCAACHTGQIDFIKPEDGSVHRIRIEGGPANVDLGEFRAAVGISLGLTKLLPRRFDRFADRLDSIRAASASPPVDREGLRADLDSLLVRGGHLAEVQDSLGIYPTTEGYARLDAIGRIANYVFSNDLDSEENLEVANAPVNFPYIWDAPRLEWVQYNASFSQPMMRNAGQSMGVFASVDLEGAGRAAEVEEDALLFSSSIDILNIHEMETLLGGCTSGEQQVGSEPRCRGDFKGLESPRWPGSVFGPLKSSAIARGDSLYARHCSECHGSYAGPDLIEDTTNFVWDDLRVALPSGGTVDYRHRYARIRVSDLWRIGTDPLAAVNFRRREAGLGELGERLGMMQRDSTATAVSGAGALAELIGKVKERRYVELGLDLDMTDLDRADSTAAAWADMVTLLRAELDGYRDPEIQAPLGYRARPLNGVWATPPFLHNGSVPTLYLLLSPQEERPRTFYLGSRLFDPESIGFNYQFEPGAFEFDTSLPGNSNQGHSFEGDEAGSVGKRGVIGPELTPKDRLAIIEYLKSLSPLAVGPGV